MKEEADHDIERQPWQIEHRCRALAGQEGSDLVEVAQRLKAVAADFDLQRSLDQRPEHAPVHHLVKRSGNTHQHPASQNLERSLKGVKHQRKDCQNSQRRYAFAGNDPVIHLKHKK